MAALAQAAKDYANGLTQAMGALDPRVGLAGVEWTLERNPGWTPVLNVVGAIGIEEGGLLNHGSIAAREPGIPVVVGIRGASRRIPDGAEITVDGGLGVVQVRPC